MLKGFRFSEATCAVLVVTVAFIGVLIAIGMGESRRDNGGHAAGPLPPPRVDYTTKGEPAWVHGSAPGDALVVLFGGGIPLAADLAPDDPCVTCTRPYKIPIPPGVWRGSTFSIVSESVRNGVLYRSVATTQATFPKPLGDLFEDRRELRMLHIWVHPERVHFSALVAVPRNDPRIVAFFADHFSDERFVEELLSVWVGDAALFHGSPRVRVQLNPKYAIVAINGELSPYDVWGDVRQPLTIREDQFDHARVRSSRDVFVLTLSGYNVKATSAEADPLPATVANSATGRTFAWYLPLNGGHTFSISAEQLPPAAMNDLRHAWWAYVPFSQPPGLFIVDFIQTIALAAMVLIPLIQLRTEPPKQLALLGLILSWTALSPLWDISSTIFRGHVGKALDGYPSIFALALHELTLCLPIAAVNVALCLALYVVLKKWHYEGLTKGFAVGIAAWSLLLIACWQYAGFFDVYAKSGTFATRPVGAIAVLPLGTALSFAVCAAAVYFGLLVVLRPDKVVEALPISATLRWITAGLLALFLAGCSLWLVPIAQFDGTHLQPAINVFDSLQMMSALEALSSLAPIAAIMLFLVAASAADVRNWTGAAWSLALVLSSVVANADFYYGLPLEWACCFGALLIVGSRSASYVKAVQVFRTDAMPKENVFDLAWIAREVRRASSEIRKAEADLVAGSLASDAYAARIRDLQTFIGWSKDRMAAVSGIAAESLAFGLGPYQSDLANGRLGAAMGAAVGVVLGLVNENPFPDLGPVPMLGFAANWIDWILGTATLGFGFGYYFPYLRGGSGATKSLILALVAGISFSPYWFFVQLRIDSIREMLELVATLGAIGLAFDYITMRLAGRTWAFKQVLELAGLGNLGAAGAVLATIATSLITSELREVVETGVKSALPAISGSH